MDAAGGVAFGGVGELVGDAEVSEFDGNIAEAGVEHIGDPHCQYEKCQLNGHNTEPPLLSVLKCLVCQGRLLGEKIIRVHVICFL